mmetsp:Transcript_20890/g.52790  ORF Transcript_20890/g.52790 Transcript_20890/m.52790 type:complete len:185 (+) Transcript_20890:164-718(+)|eukprot:g17082.t1
MASSASLATWCRKWLIAAGLFWALLGCGQGLGIGSLANKRMGKAAYHLLRHFSELLLGCAFAFPYAEFSSTLAQKLVFVCLQIAPLANFASYMVIAITNCPNPLFENSPELVASGSGAGNIYTTISTLGLTVVTSGAVLVGLGGLLYGVVRSEAGGSWSSGSGGASGGAAAGRAKSPKSAMKKK